jgi:hypothetical protein
MTPEERHAIDVLCHPETIRARSQRILELAETDELQHWSLEEDAFDHVVDYVVDEIRQNYPDLDVPYHSRLRHFDVGSTDRTDDFARRIAHLDRDERGRAWFDLIIVSVLLDAGAGPDWTFHERATGEDWSRSEGLAVASYRMFVDGLFSRDPNEPCRADAEALTEVTTDDLRDAFQITGDNPMVGLEGRVELLRELGEQVLENPKEFGHAGRPGGLWDVVADRHPVSAVDILRDVLVGLGPIWPGREAIGGFNLGDVWAHPAAGGDGQDEGLIPFHKLSQWLTYSLLEPLENEGFEVVHVEDLTGLAEYRNGGLFIDLGLLQFADPAEAERGHPTDSKLVVEWRALTVALLDRVADGVRDRLDLEASEFPLARVLQGGTWSAGRRAARERRPDGSPPIDVVRDGTVF